MNNNAKVLEEEVLEKKNKSNVRCQYCYSLILKQQQGEYVKHHLDLPLMCQKHSKNVHTIATEALQDFWLVLDMFTFENIGFSHTVDNRKYLTCADCDMGPVGYHDINTKHSYVALHRVSYGDDPDSMIETPSEAVENMPSLQA